MAIKLSHSLIRLFKHCETICEAQCCGIGAFNFSPFNIIAYLMRYNAEIRESDVKDLLYEITEFEKNYGKCGVISNGCTVQELNAILAGPQVTEISNFIIKSVNDAFSLFAKYKNNEEKRYDKYLEIINN